MRQMFQILFVDLGWREITMWAFFKSTPSLLFQCKTTRFSFGLVHAALKEPCVPVIPLSACPSVSPSGCLSLCLPVTLSISVCLSVLQPVCLPVSVSVCFSVHPSVCRPASSLCLSVFQSVCLFLSLPVCLSVGLFVCRVCLPVYLSVLFQWKLLSTFSLQPWQFSLRLYYTCPPPQLTPCLPASVCTPPRTTHTHTHFFHFWSVYSILFSSANTRVKIPLNMWTTWGEKSAKASQD